MRELKITIGGQPGALAGYVESARKGGSCELPAASRRALLATMASLPAGITLRRRSIGHRAELPYELGGTWSDVTGSVRGSGAVVDDPRRLSCAPSVP